MKNSEETLFAEAILLPSEERRRFLDDRCGTDVELKTRVERLIEAAATDDSYLDGMENSEIPETTAAHASTCDLQGRKIGPYKLLQKIGEGGFGVVFMAEQQSPVHRKVAIKIIKPGMDSDAIVARLEAERQALAMMDHPNIAKIFDGGTLRNASWTGEDARPYFVMELVRGIPITDFCDQNRLSTQERLELFQTVCFAVQHAHQKGVIHRDIKPSNVMVTLHDGKPLAKVIDFGVAKAIHQRLTEKTMFTEYGQMIGTPQYMSPEQAEMSALDVDTRSDIYSLGVLLYELLTGHTPLEAKRLREAGYAEMQRLIREEEPPRPSVRLSTCGDELTAIAEHRRVTPNRLNRDMKGDLDWIVMRALEKDRTRRYETAVDFARDIDRSLNNQAVSARKPSLLYRTRKLWRRNRSRVTIGVLAATLLIAVGGFFAYANHQANIRQKAESQQLQENTRKLQTALTKAQSKLEQAIHSPIGDNEAWALARNSFQHLQSLSHIDVPAQVHDRVDSFIKRFREAESDRKLATTIEEIVITMATHDDRATWEKMADSFKELFDEKGIDFSKQTPEQVAAVIREHKQADQLVDALELWIGTKGHLSMLGGEPATRQTMQPMATALLAADTEPLRTAIRRRLYEPHSFSAEDFEKVAEQADLSQYSARTLSWLAISYEAIGKSDKADEIFLYALTRFSNDVMLNIDYAYQLDATQRWQLAIRYYMRCTALRPDVSGIWRRLGVALRHTGELEKSQRMLEYAINLDGQHAATQIDLAETLLLRNEYAEAEKSARQAIRLDPSYPEAMGWLGRALMEQAQYDEAMEQFEKCKSAVADNPRLDLPVDEWIEQCKSRRNNFESN